MFTRFLLAGTMPLILTAVASPPNGLNPLRAEERKEPVRLTLSGATAERDETAVRFRCETVLINNTGAALNVKSNFFSAFDGLELVVFSEDGKQLLRQSYLFHQSPSFEQNQHKLEKGENRKSLVFPIGGLPKGTRAVKVLLLGTLPESEYKGLLCSDVVHVNVEESKK